MTDRQYNRAYVIAFVVVIGGLLGWGFGCKTPMYNTIPAPPMPPQMANVFVQRRVMVPETRAAVVVPPLKTNTVTISRSNYAERKLWFWETSPDLKTWTFGGWTTNATVTIPVTSTGGMYFRGYSSPDGQLYLGPGQWIVTEPLVGTRTDGK